MKWNRDAQTKKRIIHKVRGPRFGLYTGMTEFLDSYTGKTRESKFCVKPYGFVSVDYKYIGRKKRRRNGQIR